MRINKYIAHAGIASRRKADKLIEERRVKVNGKVVDDFSLQVGETDLVEVDGSPIGLEEKFYIKLNKPLGYISSNSDPHNEKDLESLVDIDKRFFAAGRLDMDSHGLMILTNDGDMVNRLIHPKFEVKKEYIVRVDKLLTKDQEDIFRESINLGDGEITTRADLILLNKKEKIYKVKIHQGFNRQIRRMFAHFGSNVLDLKRVKIGKIGLNDLKSGQYVPLDKKEIEFLKSL